MFLSPVGLGQPSPGLALLPSTYMPKLIKLFNTALIGYWPLNDRLGTAAKDFSGAGRDGANTAVTLAQPGIGDGLTSIKYDGSTSWTNAYTAALAGAFNGQEMTMMLWFQVRAASVWTDATLRSLWTILADGNNLAQLNRTATNNQLQVLQTAAGVGKGVTISTSVLGWHHLALTVSKSASAGVGRLRGYLDGAQQGADVTGLSAYAGTIAANRNTIGSQNNTPTNVFDGFLAHAALLNREATAAEILSAATIGG